MADTVGNRLGPRSFFTYTTDNGEEFKILQDESVANAVGNTAAGSSLPRLATSGTIPVECRYILLQGVSDTSIKKKVIIGDSDNALFNSLNSQQVTINNVAFTTTGRVGEKASWGAASAIVGP